MTKEEKEIAKYFTVIGIAVGFCLGGMFIICLQGFTL
jgi:hypothetical protein